MTSNSKTFIGLYYVDSYGNSISPHNSGFEEREREGGARERDNDKRERDII